MAYEQNLVTISAPAGADLSTKQYQVVKMDTSGNVVVGASTDNNVIGVLQNSPASGEMATVAVAGITKVVAAEAIALGAEVSVIAAADGKVGDSVLTTAVGICVGAAGAADELASILLRIVDHRVV